EQNRYPTSWPDCPAIVRLNQIDVPASYQPSPEPANCSIERACKPNPQPGIPSCQCVTGAERIANVRPIARKDELGNELAMAIHFVSPRTFWLSGPPCGFHPSILGLRPELRPPLRLPMPPT